MSDVKERPILFSAPMVRALLDGSKTQTRRIVKPQPLWIAEPNVPFKTPDADPKGIINCPYGKRGDRLWLREKWKPDVDGDVSCITYAADGAKVHIENTQAAACKWLDVSRSVELWPKMEASKWRSSIHMPRWASRITLEITAVRVERLQDISEADARAEGVETEEYLDRAEWAEAVAPRDLDIPCTMPSLRGEFRNLWESINGDGSWDLNPYVWAIEFKRL